MKKLEGKIAVITGASSGIGEGIARRFANEGAHIVVVSNKSVTKGEEVVKHLIELGTDSSYFQADVSSENDIDKLYNFVKEKYGKIDILINNAGGQVLSPFGKTTMDMLDQDMRVNAFGPFLLTQKFVDLMENKGWVINTSSMRSIAPRPPILGYSASKSALNNITQALATQLAPNIYVNAILPGFVETENYKAFGDDLKKDWVEKTPIKRFLTADELAEIYLLLATTEILTGNLIVADGGFTLLGR